MFKIAKSIDVNDEKRNIEIGEREIFNFNDGKKINESVEKEIVVNISGIIDNVECSIHFIITKLFQEYLDMSFYEKIKIKPEEFSDSYLIVNDEIYFDPLIDMDVLKFKNKLNFFFVFRDCENEIFGSAEFSIPLDQIII